MPPTPSQIRELLLKSTDKDANVSHGFHKFRNFVYFMIHFYIHVRPSTSRRFAIAMRIQKPLQNGRLSRLVPIFPAEIYALFPLGKRNHNNRKKPRYLKTISESKRQILRAGLLVKSGRFSLVLLRSESVSSMSPVRSPAAD